MNYVLALDQGTTSSRAIVFDREGRVVSLAQREFRQIFPQPGWVEHDAREIWATQHAVALEAMERAGAAATDFAALRPAARAEAGDLAFGTIDSWLVWNLTGGRVHATDASNASRTLLFNLHTQDWDDELLALLRIPRAVLPARTAPSTAWKGACSWRGPLCNGCATDCG